jgi:hypothetical protein
VKEHLLIFWQRKLEDAYRENYDLKAENARLKAEVERLTYVDDFIVITKPSIKQLIEQGAQNTPGRYDEQYIIQVDRECYLKVLKHMAEFWEKAKEGKQS